jgi:hypothetical protein
MSENLQRLWSLRAAGVESDATLESGSRQQRGNGLNRNIGNGDQNARSKSRQLF